jgi:steroid delta-isomerase-like uncharacterized protein
MSMTVVREWIGGWNAHDPVRVAAVFVDDFLYEDVTFGAEMRTAEEVRDFVDGFVAVAPDCHFELDSCFVSDEGGGAEWTCTGTHQGDMPGMPATGKPFTLRGASVFAFRDGGMSHCADYWDLMTFMRQLGFAPGG